MAALLARLLPSSGSLLPVPLLNVVVVRFGSRNHGSKFFYRPPRKVRKFNEVKKLDGQFVHAGNVLVTQRLLRWHPGAHVGIGRNKTLYALEDGQVRYTKEIYVPPPSSTETTEVICHLPKGALLYKTFINVVPKHEVGSFKLVNML